VRARNKDLHGSAPDKSEIALLIVDVINDLNFPEANQLLRFVPAMSRKLARLKERAKQAGLLVIYVNDNFGRWRSDFRQQIEHCSQGRAADWSNVYDPMKAIISSLNRNTRDFFRPH
jgi:nicotinamidase-related amidase